MMIADRQRLMGARGVYKECRLHRRTWIVGRGGHESFNRGIRENEWASKDREWKKDFPKGNLMELLVVVMDNEQGSSFNRD